MESAIERFTRTNCILIVSSSVSSWLSAIFSSRGRAGSAGAAVAVVVASVPVAGYSHRNLDSAGGVPASEP